MARSRSGAGRSPRQGATPGRRSGVGPSIISVSPTGASNSPRPTIQVTVKAREYSLAKHDIRLYLDGTEKNAFSYSRFSGKLSYRVGSALSPGGHTVEVKVNARGPRPARKKWTFWVSR